MFLISKRIFFCAVVILTQAPLFAQSEPDNYKALQQLQEHLSKSTTETKSAIGGGSFVRLNVGVVAILGLHTGLEVWVGGIAISGRAVAAFVPEFSEVNAFVHIGSPLGNVYGGVGHRNVPGRKGRIWAVGLEIDTSNPDDTLGYGVFIDYHSPLNDESGASRGFVIGGQISVAFGGG